MKIAVTYENGNVFPHFGRTEQFKVYEIEAGKIVDAQVKSTDGKGHGALAGLLSGWGVNTLICGGIGAGAQTALMEAGIKFYGGVAGSADEAIDALLLGTLSRSPEIHCNHQGHGHQGEDHLCAEVRNGCPGCEKF